VSLSNPNHSPDYQPWPANIASVTLVTFFGDMSQRLPGKLEVFLSTKCPTMKTLIVELTNNLTGQNHYFPAVSMIMPFNPKMSNKKALSNSLGMALSKIENDLYDHFPEEMSGLVMQKLKSVTGKLDFSTHSISIAIFISPFFEKLLYLDFPVEKKIVVDESFDIRDLVYSKKEMHEYLVLQLSQDECRLYLGSPGGLVRILSNTPRFVHFSQTATPAETGNGQVKAHELTTENYLHYNDNVLDVILKAYPLPLFVLGNATLTSYFKGLTKHGAAITNYLEGDYDKAGIEQLKTLLQPQLADWKKVKEKRLLSQLAAASGNQLLATGLNNVWREARNRGGHLLIFEKDYPYQVENQNANNVIEQAMKPYKGFSCIKDQLDEAIDRVLENGGDVEFVDKDVLKAFDHVALLK
jgi:hypothetical protein